MSRGQVLVRFMKLQEKIKEFLQDHNRALYEQLTDAFWIKMAHLADTFTLGPDSNVTQCRDALSAFVRKLVYRVRKMSKGEPQQFPLLMKQSEFTRHINLLWEEIKSCFADIEYLSKELWVMNSYIFSLEDVEYLSCEDECVDLQAASGFKKYFQKNGYKMFWIAKGHTVAPRLAKHAVTRVILPISTAYLTETAFSTRNNRNLGP